MAQALAEARKGLFSTYPNPRVGCVIVRDSRIVGRGWHEAAGLPHAEVGALAEAGEHARGATAYVNLEPCSHHGRTPPCADALIKAGISRCVVAHRDPFVQVAGRGIQRLRDAGIEVVEGVRRREAMVLNRGFITLHERAMPWVRVKLAASLDGKTALSNGASQWITGEEAREDVQQWRAQAHLVLTGMGTFLADDPSLNVRIDTPRQPIRMVIGSRPPTTPDARFFRCEGPIWWAAPEDQDLPSWLEERAERIFRLPRTEHGMDLHRLMGMLADAGICEVHVEAGETLAGELLAASLIDELVLYLAPSLLGRGRGLFGAPTLESMDERVNLAIAQIDRLGKDIRIVAQCSQE